MYTTGTDAFLVSNHYNVLYLSGFEGQSTAEREAFIFITKKELYFITDGRYEMEKGISAIFNKLITDAQHSPSFFVDAICRKERIKTVGFDAKDMSFEEVNFFKKKSFSFISTTDPFKNLREQKNKDELSFIRKACRIGDAVLEDILPLITPGKTEREIAWKLESIIRGEYKAEIAFDPIVAAGANAALPHYNTKKGGGRVTNNSLLLIDFGVKWQNYCSDVTRMVAVGEIDSEIHNAYEVLKTVQEETKNKIKHVRQLCDIDLFCKKALEKEGYKQYPHSTGHGVGLEVHEWPKVGALSKDIKKKSQVFTIEPGIYVPHKWGMRLEDVIYITSFPDVQNLTCFPRELIHV